MNTLITAVYDEKSLRRKIRQMKILQVEMRLYGSDPASLQENFGGFSEFDGEASNNSTEFPILIE